MFAYEPQFRKDAPAGLFLSRKGNWFHDGDLLEHQRMCALLHRSIARDEHELIVTTGRDRLVFVAEDAPYRVQKIELISAEPSVENLSSQYKKAVLHLSDEAKEELSSVHSFRSTKDGSIFVSVKNNGFWARLSSGAQQVLQPFLEFDEAEENYFWILDEKPAALSAQKWLLKQVDAKFDSRARPY